MITVQLEPKDLAEAHKLHMRWGPWAWFFNCLPTVLDIGFSFWLIFWLPDLLSMGIALIVLAILFWTFLAYVKFILPSQIARRQFKQQKRLQRSSNLSWDDSAFTSESETGVARTPWSDFLKWRESEYLFLLYVGRALFTIVPKRVFNNPHDVAHFGQILQRCIGNEGKWRHIISGKAHPTVTD